MEVNDDLGYLCNCTVGYRGSHCEGKSTVVVVFGILSLSFSLLAKLMLYLFMFQANLIRHGEMVHNFNAFNFDLRGLMNFRILKVSLLASGFFSIWYQETPMRKPRALL